MNTCYCTSKDSTTGQGGCTSTAGQGDSTSKENTTGQGSKESTTGQGSKENTTGQGSKENTTGQGDSTSKRGRSLPKAQQQGTIEHIHVIKYCDNYVRIFSLHSQIKVNQVETSLSSQNLLWTITTTYMYFFNTTRSC